MGGPGEIVQLRALPILAEDLGSVPSIHAAPHSCPGQSGTFSWIPRHQEHTGTSAHTYMLATYTHTPRCQEHTNIHTLLKKNWDVPDTLSKDISFVCVLFDFRDRLLLYNPVWPITHCATQADLRLTETLLPPPHKC